MDRTKLASLDELSLDHQLASSSGHSFLYFNTDADKALEVLKFNLDHWLVCSILQFFQMGLKKLGFTGKCIETIQGLVGNVYVSVRPGVLSELVKALGRAKMVSKAFVCVLPSERKEV